MKNYLTLLRRQEQPARFVAARLLMLTRACRFLTIPQQGFSLRFHPSNLSCQLWISPRRRDDALQFFRDYLRSGDEVVDVGANIGDTTLVAAVSVGSKGRVIAFEAHPRTFRWLVENLRLNRFTNIEAINVALGNQARSARFADDRRDDMNMVDGGDLIVPMKRLDDLIQGRNPIALLKVDVEGYEKQVLEGAVNTLRRTQCVHFEVGTEHFKRFGYTVEELLSFLNACGFHLFRMTSQRTLSSISTEFTPPSVENLIGLRNVTEFTRRTGWTIEAVARTVA